jgi:hypothetical protein
MNGQKERGGSKLNIILAKCVLLWQPSVLQGELGFKFTTTNCPYNLNGTYIDHVHAVLYNCSASVLRRVY